ncbi:MAG TPA: chromosomal replication initiator protein DnaA, partial [Bacteroidetes bacterium]|nr:chromosomal replication initiator protein DnaA [Bacteroidota bacterium]
HVSTKYPNKRIQYVSSEKFTLEFINSIKNNRVPEFSLHYRNVDILLVDDVQFFINKERTQEEFFHTFNDLQQKGKQIVLSSDRPPQELAGLENRLISRFSSGLIADVQPPDLETRIAILQRKAEQDELQLPDEITQFIATNITSNIRQLEGALIKLLAYSSLNGEDITLKMAKHVLKDLIKKKNTSLSIELIQSVVSHYFSIKEDLIRAKTRKKEIVGARQISMYLSKNLTHNSLKTIGLHFGGRDHTTVIHAFQTIEKRIQTEPTFREMIQDIQDKIELEAQ